MNMFVCVLSSSFLGPVVPGSGFSGLFKFSMCLSTLRCLILGLWEPRILHALNMLSNWQSEPSASLSYSFGTKGCAFHGLHALLAWNEHFASPQSSNVSSSKLWEGWIQALYFKAIFNLVLEKGGRGLLNANSPLSHQPMEQKGGKTIWVLGILSSLSVGNTYMMNQSGCEW